MSACDVVENKKIHTIDQLAPLAQLSVLKADIHNPEQKVTEVTRFLNRFDQHVTEAFMPFVVYFNK